MDGKLIVIEGADGVGKKTQSDLLLDYIFNTKMRCFRYSFPRYRVYSGAPCEMYLRGELGDPKELSPIQISSLFAVDRLCTIKQDKWERCLKDGMYIVCDRYTESNVIYQTAFHNTDFKSDSEKYEFAQNIFDFEYKTLGIIKPDVVLYLRLTPDISKSLIDHRGLKKDIHEEDNELQQAVHEIGLDLAKFYNWEVIDCFEGNSILSKENIFNKIIERLEKRNIL